MEGGDFNPDHEYWVLDSCHSRLNHRTGQVHVNQWYDIVIAVSLPARQSPSSTRLSFGSTTSTVGTDERDRHHQWSPVEWAPIDPRMDAVTATPPHIRVHHWNLMRTSGIAAVAHC